MLIIIYLVLGGDLGGSWGTLGGLGGPWGVLGALGGLGAPKWVKGANF